MKKELYATLALFTICGYSSAQTVSVIGLDDNTIATYRLDQIKQIVFTPAEEGKEDSSSAQAVDLGLPSGLKWASCNVGASSPEDYGGYYAWGETKEKSEYSWETYFDPNYTINTDIAGTEYDVAHVKWGGSWRLPRLEDIHELLIYCTMQWITLNGVTGRKVTGPNGNSIFLPAAGSYSASSFYGASLKGCFWSSSPDDQYSDEAYYFYFFMDHNFTYYSGGRVGGLSVRPVTE